ncbi:YcaO-like family protein [Mycobacterium ostraviense]|nr:YcaO-like family protein [Mycobacterium ostraviense]UGT94489.1 YcaO-like family protein [Mycobacterium ostraviense]
MESLEYWHAENATADLRFTSADDLDPALTYDSGSHHRGAGLDRMAATTLLAVVRCGGGYFGERPVGTTDVHHAHPRLASGNSYCEAALHGLYEIMERHAVGTAVAGSTMWAVRPPDLDGADCADLVDQVHRAGSQLRIARLDVWQDHYCFAAELISPTSSVQFGGSGLQHDPKVALSRAITLAAQSRLTAISGTREDIPATIYERLTEAPAASDVRSATRIPVAAPASWWVPDTDSLPTLVAAAATAVARRTGIEAVAVVCDSPGACVPVVKVVAVRPVVVLGGVTDANPAAGGRLSVPERELAVGPAEYPRMLL